MPKLKIVDATATAAFGSKADTLAWLNGRLHSARLLPMQSFTVEQWQAKPEDVLSQIAAEPWGSDALAVRSAAQCEDGAEGSMAGAFATQLNVRGEQALRQAVETVIASYGAAGTPRCQVLVQPMLADIVAAGVAFGCDPNTGAPYRVINYDDTSGQTDSVTSGRTNALKTWVVHQLAPAAPDGLPQKVIALLDELAEHFATQAIDIEFAQTRDGALTLLQARPLVMTAEPVAAQAHYRALERIADSVRKGLQPHPYLHGRRTVYGVMPDWNPAEIIGIRPRPLALSLYRELVTDAIWAYQRDNYGYGNLRSFPLLLDFEGLPYIDVRASFNSFLPKELSAGLAEKLSNYYIDRLIETPALHDKVEFKIVFSCYTLDLKKRMEVLSEYGFSDREREELATALTGLTNRILHRDQGLWKKDLQKIGELERRQQVLEESTLDDISKLYWLVEDCKRYGTLPFAGLARVGFIAVQLLHSFVGVGIITEDEYQRFLASLETVSTQMSHDLYALPRGTFLQNYGHLRPGTYDILSPRYDETPERYFDWPRVERERETARKEKYHTFSLSLAQLKQIESCIQRDGLEIDTIGLLEFIKTGIEAREYSKFVFTRNVSDFLRLFQKIAGEHGFAREDCAYADIRDIMALYSCTHDVEAWLRQSIERGKARHAITRSITLPPLLVSPEEAWSFGIPESQPNFVTQGMAEGETADATAADFSGKIVLIESADPGYDWLFSHPIGGFITRFGGVNSHMAIRSGELGIPAVIGAGDALFGEWSRAKRLLIDCANRQVQVLA